MWNFLKHKSSRPSVFTMAGSFYCRMTDMVFLFLLKNKTLLFQFESEKPDGSLEGAALCLSSRVQLPAEDETIRSVS